MEKELAWWLGWWRLDIRAGDPNTPSWARSSSFQNSLYRIILRFLLCQPTIWISISYHIMRLNCRLQRKSERRAKGSGGVHLLHWSARRECHIGLIQDPKPCAKQVGVSCRSLASGLLLRLVILSDPNSIQVGLVIKATIWGRWRLMMDDCSAGVAVFVLLYVTAATMEAGSGPQSLTGLRQRAPQKRLSISIN